MPLPDPGYTKPLPTRKIPMRQVLAGLVDSPRNPPCARTLAGRAAQLKHWSAEPFPHLEGFPSRGIREVSPGSALPV